MSTQAVSGTAAPPGRGWALALASIVGAEFMLQLDGTVVNVALPSLQSDLGLPVTAASWVPNGFLLAFGGLLLLAGRLGDVLGHRRVFLGGIGLVVVASLIAGLAQNLETLILGRVLQGAGAALAGPTGLALIPVISPQDRLQRSFGLYSTVTGLGASAGMVLGGVLTWAGDWRWSLLVNVPVGLLIIAVALRALGLADAAAGERRPLGLPSALLVSASVLAAVYGLVHAAEEGWGDPLTLGPLAAALVLAAALALTDRRSADPLLPGEVFAGRDRAGAVINLLLLASVLTGFLIYLVQYLQSVLELDALRSGLAILPFGLALLASTQLLTRFVAGIDLKVRAVAGLVPVLAGVLWLSRLDGGSGYAAGVLGPIVLMGLGVGIAIIPLNMIVLTTVPARYSGVTAGVLQTALTIGGSLGLAVLLIPFTSGSGDPAETAGTVFAWSAGIIALAVAVGLAFWFGPGARRTPPPAQAEAEAAPQE